MHILLTLHRHCPPLASCEGDVWGRLAGIGGRWQVSAAGHRAFPDVGNGIANRRSLIPIAC